MQYTCCDPLPLLNATLVGCWMIVVVVVVVVVDEMK
jgi:hypothetical protein